MRELRGTLVKSLVVVGLGCLLAAAAGCAVSEPVNYSDVGVIKRVTNRILSPRQKEAEIRDLTLDQKRHREDAEKEIEKR